ncbi:PQQ-dependent sugar dehydrogenase [Chitinophaga filiformis]|uniref:PQQ-dependent sugar dehydrogenase n=1 Tax=Chitinophaga filiformis TaxID=104663 RepID=UPI001F1A203C|nr:PQQ-dependent sugar dehydrogenase [Chitinophaga filiformis]MCF6407606.1 PQQ-dependent sugar dehydrogenase [Chitinophaga filiformis]MCF6407689.1 PQQ-dependent sugar dehydrogenase [Chitinophaga filiformis]
MQKTKVCLIVALAMTAITTSVFAGGPGKPGAIDVKPDANNAGLKLPAGFGALKVADSLGRARHIAVTSNGGIYIKLDRAKNNNGILFLQDANGDGKIDKKTGFGVYGGTGIYVKGDYLYASSNEDIYRYKLDAQQQVIDPEHPQTVVSGLINRRQHESKSIVLDDNGNIYVNIGAYSNSCQTKDRTAGSLGMQPCPVLDSAAGIWQFKADKQNQTYGDGVRYATGLRNVVGLDWNKSLNQLFVMQHGRDQLHDLFPNLYTEKQSADLPAECMYALKQGSDCGWPYIYYDPFQHKKMLAPEYGGDGKKTGGDNIEEPVVAFPAHMAPNGLLFYTGTQFPEKYRNGAFVAFHGSWNRSPENQAGFYVVFVPFKDGKPSGKWEVFADGFAGPGPIKSPGDAAHRPCGLAQGPDGSLYVTDDVKGTVYRIVYKTK